MVLTEFDMSSIVAREGLDDDREARAVEAQEKFDSKTYSGFCERWALNTLVYFGDGEPVSVSDLPFIERLWIESGLSDYERRVTCELFAVFFFTRFYGVVADGFV
jgi:hypothetical protein